MTAPSYEQLVALVAAQQRLIARLQARIAEQGARAAGSITTAPARPVTV